MDKELNYHRQISSVAKICFYHLRNIRRIRSSLTEKAAKTLINALVTSRLDHNNSLLLGVPKFLTNRIQRVQNCAARLVINASKFDHISPILKTLHWLPVHLRIQFKVLLMVYRSLHKMAPDYICDLLHPVASKYRLRSAIRYQLHTPRTNLVSAGDRAFSAAAPKLWNKLPINNNNNNNNVNLI